MQLEISSMPRTKIPHNIINSVLIEAGYRCAVPTCRNILAIDMHHIIEVKDGGPNEPSHLLALCPTCHALYTRGTIPKEAINAWKTMLVTLSHAFDQESISNLLFLHVTEKQFHANLSKFKTNVDEVMTRHLNGQPVGKEKAQNLLIEMNMLIVSGDGVLKFSHLIASGLAQYNVVVIEATNILYHVELTQKGRQIVNSWFSGNRQNVQEALGSVPAN